MAETQTDHPAVVVPERPELASKIQDQFDKVFGSVNESDLIEDDPAGEEVADTGAAEQSPTDEVIETPADEQPATETAAAATEAAPAASAGPTLPEAYRRSLKAYEWTDAEIDANLKALGPSFIQTAAKLHQTRHKETNAWAELGRKARTGTGEPATPTPTEAAPQKSQPAEAAFLPKVDAAKLKSQYGEEALIDALTGPVNSAIDQINKWMPVIQQTQARAQSQEMEGMHRQIDGFFGSKELKPYHETYGTKTATLTNEQLTARQKVLEFADAIVVGARSQGRYLALDEAMQMAHDSVSNGTQTTAARKEITQQMTQRNKGITLKPSARTASTPTGPAANRSALEKNVAKGLAGLFR